MKKMNPNLGGLSRGSFLPPCSSETTSLKSIPSFEFPYISFILYIILLWPNSVLTKNLSRRKEVHINVFLNWFMLILIICNSCYLQRNFLPYITKRWWYCSCKILKSEKWCHLLQDGYSWQEPNPRCPKLFFF